MFSRTNSWDHPNEVKQVRNPKNNGRKPNPCQTLDNVILSLCKSFFLLLHSHCKIHCVPTPLKIRLSLFLCEVYFFHHFASSLSLLEGKIISFMLMPYNRHNSTSATAGMSVLPFSQYERVAIEHPMVFATSDCLRLQFTLAAFRLTIESLPFKSHTYHNTL